MEQKHTVAAVVVAVLALGWFFRFELVPPPAGTSGIYKLDRFTGTVYAIHGGKQVEVTTKAPEN